MTRRTVLKGSFTMVQDITKGNPNQTWEADGVIGEPVNVDGDEFWHGKIGVPFAATGLIYAEYDGKIVARIVGSNTSQYTFLRPIGALSRVPPLPDSIGGAHEISIETFQNERNGQVRIYGLWGGSTSDDTYTSLYQTSSSDNQFSLYATAKGPDDVDSSGYLVVPDAGSTTWPPVNQWISYKLQMDFENLIIKGKRWDGFLEDEPVDWHGIEPITPFDSRARFFPAHTTLKFQRTGAAGSVLAIRRFKWEKLA